MVRLTVPGTNLTLRSREPAPLVSTGAPRREVVGRGMGQTLRRLILGIVVVAVIGIMPVVSMGLRDADTAVGGAGAKPGTTGSPGGPKKTRPPQATPSVSLTASTVPTPSVVPTPGPTVQPTLAPSPAPTLAPTAAPTLAPTAAPPAVLVGAGDIASCSSTGDEATAALLDTIGGTVFTLGDNVYDNGTSTEFTNCYGPSWGRPTILNRTKPTAGNHEYNTLNATGYYAYFGTAAGDPTKGYYAYNHGTWRVYVLNSNCASIGGCAAGSAQELWLRADLAANPRGCVVAMWHHPRFSSGEHGNNTNTQPLWQALYDANADLILAGHDHHYERFAPQTATGVADASRGIVEFVVGTGGRSHYAVGTVRANSLVRNHDTYGVLRLSLSSGGYAFNFIPVTGSSFTDAGTGTCH
jgi:hypothetical protein